MGMPNIPSEMSTNITISHEGLIRVLLMSIALEELSLSHILNAEGEFMQTFLKGIKCNPCTTYEDLLRFNRNMTDTLRVIVEKEKTLRDKLIQVVSYDLDHHDRK